MELRFPANLLLCHLVFSGDTCLENIGKKRQMTKSKRDAHLLCFQPKTDTGNIDTK